LQGYLLFCEAYNSSGDLNNAVFSTPNLVDGGTLALQTGMSTAFAAATTAAFAPSGAMQIGSTNYISLMVGGADESGSIYLMTTDTVNCTSYTVSANPVVQVQLAYEVANTGGPGQGAGLADGRLVYANGETGVLATYGDNGTGASPPGIEAWAYGGTVSQAFATGSVTQTAGAQVNTPQAFNQTTSVSTPNQWSNFVEWQIPTATPNTHIPVTVSIPSDGSSGSTISNISWEIWGRQQPGQTPFKIGGWDCGQILAGAGLLAKNTQQIPAGNTIPYALEVAGEAPVTSLLFRHMYTNNPNSVSSTANFQGAI
jgi:hypothetical protein